MQFDVRAARALAAGDHLTVEGAPGLRLIGSGDGRAWTYRYKSPLDGRMRQIKIGMWPALSAAQAGVEWERLRKERDAGRDPSMERKVARAAELSGEGSLKANTVGDLLEGFVRWAAPRRASKGVAQLRRMLDTMVDQRLRALPPAKVTRSVAYDVVNKFAATPVQAAALRRELGAAWDWGHDSGRLDDDVPNWWRQVLRGKLQSKGKIVGGEHQGQTKRVLSPEDVGAVIRHLPHLSHLNADLLTLYLWTGCRGSEIVQMEGRELSVDGSGVLWWIVPRGKVKMSRHPLAADLPVPLLGRARELVLARKDRYGDGHLFPPTRGKSPHVEQKVVGVAVWWHMPRCVLRPEQERPRWPVEDWSPHDLRRTVRTQLARMGCPDTVAEAVLGHLDTDAGIYNRHEYREERLLWLTKLVEAWESASRR